MHIGEVFEGGSRYSKEAAKLQKEGYRFQSKDLNKGSGWVVGDNWKFENPTCLYKLTFIPTPYEVELNPELLKKENRPETYREFLLYIEQAILAYSNEDNWKVEPQGEAPYYLAKGLPLNFRPSLFTQGWVFAQEILENTQNCLFFEGREEPVEESAEEEANSKQVGGSHYKVDGEEHWDRVYRLFGPGYLVGCITKYVERYSKKNGKEDLQKAIHYLEKLIELEYPEDGPS
jgi:hypothetical protein